MGEPLGHKVGALVPQRLRTIAGVTGAGQNAYVTISNKAEGCAPLAVRSLAKGLSNLRAP